MTWTGLETFDTAVQKADLWLKEIMEELNTDSRRIAYMSLRAVLHTLRDRLLLDEAVDLGAQLPLLIKGIYYDEWKPSITPVKDRHIDEFLAHIKEKYRADGTVDMEKLLARFLPFSKRKLLKAKSKMSKVCYQKNLNHYGEVPADKPSVSPDKLSGDTGFMLLHYKYYPFVTLYSLATAISGYIYERPNCPDHHRSSK